jgi:hypothetical protein
MIIFTPNTVIKSTEVNSNFDEVMADINALGVWQSYTPTTTNITLGNGTLTSKYAVIGKTLFYEGQLVRGSTTSFSGQISFTTPATMNSTNKTNESGIGIATAIDFGAAIYACTAVYSSSTVFVPIAQGVGGTWNTISSANRVSATVPFTWGTGDIVTWNIVVEVA